MTTTARISPIPLGTRRELAELEAKIIAKRGRITPLYQHLLNSPEMAQGGGTGIANLDVAFAAATSGLSS
jgi:hypothetical protein